MQDCVLIVLPVEGTPRFIGNHECLGRVLLTLNNEWLAVLTRAAFSNLTDEEVAEMVETVRNEYDLEDEE